jgi:hypothetical protein
VGLFGWVFYCQPCLVELELGQGGGGQAADLAGEAGAQVHQPDVVSQVVQSGETRITLPAHDVRQGPAVGSFPGHFYYYLFNFLLGTVLRNRNSNFLP